VRTPVEPEYKGQGKQRARHRTPRQRDTGQALVEPDAKGQRLQEADIVTIATQAQAKPESKDQ
jgi:hypothetical protein